MASAKILTLETRRVTNVKIPYKSKMQATNLVGREWFKILMKKY